MPTVLKIQNLRFYFYANDHEPIHVHIKGGGAMAKVILDPTIEIVESSGFSPKDKREIKKICRIYQSYLIDQWEVFFDDQD